MQESALHSKLETAREHHRDGALDEAERLYAEVLGEQPDQPDALHMLGQLRLQQERAQEARNLLERAVAGKPDDATCHNSLGVVLQALGDVAAAERAYRRAVELDPNMARAYNNLGYVQLLQRKLDDAERSLNLALRCQERYPEALVTKGNVLLERGEYDAATKPLMQALEYAPNLATAHASLGLAFRGQNAASIAAQCFENAVENRPDFGRAHALLGSTLVELGRLSEAERALNRAIELEPDFAEAYVGQGDLARARGRAEEAAGFYRKALELRPRFDAATEKLARLYLERGLGDSAVETYNRRLQAGNAGAEVYAALGHALLQMNRHASARQALEAALERDPDDHVARGWLAVSLEALGRLDEAAAVAERAVAGEASQVPPRLVQARAALRQGDTEGALGWLEPIAEARLPRDQQARAAHLRGLIHDRRGDYDTAYDAFTQANRARTEQLAPAEDREILTDCLREHTRQAQIAHGIDSERAAEWREAVPDDGRAAPVFLLGFPGAGVLALGHCLAAHPRLHVATDRDLGGQRGDFVQRWSSGAALGDIGAGELLAERRRYWKRLAHRWPEADAPGGNGLGIVDQLPAQRAPLDAVARLFPDARLVLVERDPHDICLHGLVRSLGEPLLRAGVCSIEDLARYYLAWQQWIDAATASLPLRVHRVRYEDFDRDPAATLAPLVDFLEVDWQDAVADAYRDLQVTATGVAPYAPAGHWQCYREPLERAWSLLDSS